MYTYKYGQRLKLFSWKLLSFGLIMLVLSTFALIANFPRLRSSLLTRNVARVDKALKNATSEVAVKAPIQENELLDLVNKERSKNKLHPLVLDDKLAISAAEKCKDMADNNYWSHIGSKGQQPWNYIANAGFQHITTGENLAYGFNESTIVVQAWINSPEHRAVILNKTYNKTGFAICASSDYISSGPQTIVVQHLALGLK